jgi:hypothetical protein
MKTTTQKPQMKSDNVGQLAIFNECDFAKRAAAILSRDPALANTFELMVQKYPKGWVDPHTGAIVHYTAEYGREVEQIRITIERDIIAAQRSGNAAEVARLRELKRTAITLARKREVARIAPEQAPPRDLSDPPVVQISSAPPPNQKSTTKSRDAVQCDTQNHAPHGNGTPDTSTDTNQLGLPFSPSQHKVTQVTDGACTEDRIAAVPLEAHVEPTHFEDANKRKPKPLPINGHPSKTFRFICLEDLALAEFAAELIGVSTNHFATQAAVKAARQVILNCRQQHDNQPPLKE